MKVELFFASFFLCFTSVAGILDYLDDYLDADNGNVAFTEITDTEDDLYNSAYAFSYEVPILASGFASHWHLYRFEINYVTDTGDADSDFGYTYYEMVYDSTYTCVPDPLNDQGTLSTETEYTTLFDGGDSDDPCGYYVLLDYQGENINGKFYVYTDGAVVLESLSLIWLLLANLFY
eukprot:CAMPEP_0170551114 /NCGR_PEP_ID=MMETSP0211-20121228/9135_1 /TAXON_ID=311385 /ORGANISM="Pseudokeronopsis sp., Strain OXSARD2" /LENGTH=176 /DNA_ID=CAMNT_0010858081 /DNA_START=38 /DNA_END=568 /DNA_ORIENTATION=+